MEGMLYEPEIANLDDGFDVNYEQFENDTALAIENSLSESSNFNSLEGILRELQGKIDENKTAYFNIYRNDVFNCCVRALRRKTFCPFNKISVKFSDIEGNTEGAVDAGGPTREMFRLAINCIKHSRLFFGEEEKKYIRLDMESLKNYEYLEAGRIISLSLIHGGPGPHFFSEYFFSIIVHGFDDIIPTINEVEPDIRGKIEKINDIEEINMLQEYIIDEAIFSIAGCYFIKKIEDKGKLFEDVLKFYAFHRIRPVLDQFKEGLKTGNILELMEKHPDKFKDVMCYNNNVQLTTDILENLFEIEYSEIGTNKRDVENRVICFWCDVLLDCEEDDDGLHLSLKDILIFATGADRIPPLGFQHKPKISFLHTDSLYPTANTCGLELYLPTKHIKFEEFKKFVVFGIANCSDFAFA